MAILRFLSFSTVFRFLRKLWFDESNYNKIEDKSYDICLVRHFCENSTFFYVPTKSIFFHKAEIRIPFGASIGKK